MHIISIAVTPNEKTSLAKESVASCSSFSLRIYYVDIVFLQKRILLLFFENKKKEKIFKYYFSFEISSLTILKFL